jgi:small subunit ribosomal protein S20
MALMPITSSAHKALRSSKRKKVFNLTNKRSLNDAIKTFKKLIADKKKKEAVQALSVVYKAIDKAAKTNLIKKNTASRKKSRLAVMISKIV